jgi:Zn finger protein HypA/HybF involved in hydrogenase expression
MYIYLKEDNMSYKFTDEDRINSNKQQIADAIAKYLKKGTHPSNAWLRKTLSHQFEYKCSGCGIVEWNNKSITLEIDHINGDNTDNRIENLRYLCPNCHSQTETYKGKNINSGFIKVTDEELLDAYLSEGNIRKALIKVGLSPRGANYSRMYKILSAKDENL